jgi:hypothetical protein
MIVIDYDRAFAKMSQHPAFMGGGWFEKKKVPIGRGAAAPQFCNVSKILLAAEHFCHIRKPLKSRRNNVRFRGLFAPKNAILPRIRAYFLQPWREALCLAALLQITSAPSSAGCLSG